MKPEQLLSFKMSLFFVREITKNFAKILFEKRILDHKKSCLKSLTICVKSDKELNSHLVIYAKIKWVQNKKIKEIRVFSRILRQIRLID
ncbi:hypothetical protein BpHYR1_039463 [Brachionus plicatilis]|uniref:Uncharacterized protein n=1 Tax=Brachionus plicatilis TaxID=10195 RepID=A0A3M7P9W2_BRAPC|nr:hypothetical protein BpHYR1_039463 [Brachionus plicatilis]